MVKPYGYATHPSSHKGMARILMLAIYKTKSQIKTALGLVTNNAIRSFIRWELYARSQIAFRMFSIWTAE